jgi:phosphopantothenoylcysteine decarboxylase/phosphopantothenate--cysteine ligase
MRSGCRVRVCLTDAASRFVTPALFEALTGSPCLQGAFDEVTRGAMTHIEWAREADLMLVAPATANTICKLASGTADDMLTTIALATTAPWVIAPAMNPQMYASDPVREALRVLKGRAAAIVEPEEGEVACGEQGQGKLAANARIVGVVRAVLARREMLSGRTLLLTMGPTRERIDDVRFLTNRSSGKMGAALARAATAMGARVMVVTGPTTEPLPPTADVRRVESAREMLAACQELAPSADVIVGAAAVSDFRPEAAMEGKIRRTGDEIVVRLVPNADIIAELASSYPEKTTIGFAAEPGGVIEVARQKLESKGLAAICVNDIAGPDSAFESDSNDVTWVPREGEPERSGRMSKLECAYWVLERAAGLVGKSLA